MRNIVLSIETTGHTLNAGHRVIELACVELIDEELTGRNFHSYFNPDRDIDPRSQALHGISLETLSDKPKFADFAASLHELARDAVLILHNATFDLSILNHECGLAGLPPVERNCQCVVDTLALARERFPGRTNSISALCNQYRIDVANGHAQPDALDNAIGLASIYLRLTAHAPLPLSEGYL